MWWGGETGESQHPVTLEMLGGGGGGRRKGGGREGGRERERKECGLSNLSSHLHKYYSSANSKVVVSCCGFGTKHVTSWNGNGPLVAYSHRISRLLTWACWWLP